MFPKLFEAGMIGGLNVRNRIVMPPLTGGFAHESGAVSPRLVDYYAERAKGGVGLIIVEAAVVDHPTGNLIPVELRIDRDLFIPGLNDLAEAVKKNHARVALQIAHAGRQTTLAATQGVQPVSASDFTFAGIKARGLEKAEIEGVVEKFGEAARRAKTAGFDAVEIHGAHGYLIHQFMSPYTNKRTDEYGGDLAGRMKFPLQVIDRVRQKVGKDYPLLFRMNGADYVDGGLTPEETVVIARMLEEASVNAIDVSAGIRESAHWTHAPMAVPPAYLAHLAEGIKKTVNVPVITVGRFNDPEAAERALREGKADFVAMGRALVADPDLPRKARQGRLEDIRYCIGCTRGCIGRLLVGGLRISCDVNPAVGKEREYELKPATRSREVLVVGGGPGGLEAARIAALRGHKVTLLEKGGRLGGQLLLATASPYKGEVKRLLNYLSKQVEKAGVHVELNTLATAEMVLDRKPDVVIVATGAQPLIPDIPGADGRNVATAWDVLSGAIDVGGEVAIVGGGMVGCEAAEFLAEKGKKVRVIEMLSDIALDMPPRARAWLLQRFQQQGIGKLVDSKVHGITDAGVMVQNGDGQRSLVEAANVVIAMGAKPNNELTAALRNRLDEVYDIGDCVKPRQMMEAIHEGSHIARII